ncbi:MAG TPA: ATPase domain-containing protein [Acidimicrobiia bacterium]|nr:ATPase domain-containing protein [Acidimicrobiia bacterium]
MSVDRVSSGNQRLDEVFDGGLRPNGIVLITGLPGAGKTILAQQFLFANATTQRPGLYLSTVSEPLEKILRYGETLDFFDQEAVGTSVFYQDFGDVLAEGGLQALLENVEELLKTRTPGVLVIDSFKVIHDYVTDTGELRSFLHHLAGMLSAFPVTTFLLGEYALNDGAKYPEFAVVDAVVGLRFERVGHRENRVLEIAKLRGSDFRSGRHAYRLSSSGLACFPRLADVVDTDSYHLSAERLDSGVSGLDEMLADGFTGGTSTLVAGPAGAGKTLLGLHYIFAGARQGQPGVIAVLQENPMQLERMCSGFGWSLAEDNVELMYRSPVDLHIDEWVYDLLDTVERVGAKRVLIDSLGDIRLAAADEIRFREYMYSLLQRLSKAGIGLVMTQESAEFYAITRLDERGISHVSDNVILLHHVAEGGELSRAITILKTRGSQHDHTVRNFVISDEGITVGDKVPNR